MLNQVFKVSSGTCQQSVEVLSKSVTFLDFHNVMYQSNILQVMWKSLWCIHTYTQRIFLRITG